MQNNNTEEKQAAELIIANKELAFQNEEKEKRAQELIIANKELAFQNEEKEKRAAELILANKELAFQNEEKGKRAAELINSEMRYRRLFESAKDGVLILDAETGMIDDVNPFLINLLGYSHEEFIGKKIWDIGFFKDIFASYENFLELQQKEYIRYEDLKLKTSEGKGINVEFVSNVYLVNNQKVIQCNIRDITERKKAEAEILKLNRVYKVLSNVNEMIVRTTNTEEILKESCNIAVTDGEFLTSWMGFVNNETNEVDILSYSGIGRDYIEDINIDFNDKKLSGGPTGIAIKTGTHEISNDIENDVKMIPWREEALKIGYKSSAAFPIKVFGEIVFVYNLYSGEVNFFDEDEIKLLDELVMDMSFALEFVAKEKARKKAEEELKSSQQIIEGILNTIPVRVFWKDKNLTYLGCNKIFAIDAGFTDPKDIVGKNDFQMGWKEQAELYQTDDRIVIDSGRSILNIEEPQTTPDGKTITLLTSKIPFRNSKEEITGILGIYLDITDRKMAEVILKESEEKYRKLIQTMPEGFYRSTPEGYFVDVNPALVKMLGYESKEELMKIYIPEELYFSKDDREVNVQNIDFTNDTDAYRLKKKDGSEIWVVDYGRYVKDDSGKVVFHEGIMRDVTESLHAQKAIIEAKDKAEEMSRLKSSFLANMSHEIRTPLNGILGFAQLLEQDVKDEAQLKCVKVIEKSGNRLLETLDLILNFSKLEAEMVSAKYSDVNVCNVIDEVVDSFEAMAKNKNLFIETKINLKNFVLKIDDRFLRHVLNNLVKNAIVYTDKGGITVTFDKDEKDMIFKVKDTGIGITKEYYEVIFEPFRQESEGWGRNFEGTGLGLSITKRFVELMKGKIEVESEVGTGSTFTVRLPFTETEATTETKTGKKEPAKKAPVGKTPEKKELSILLVENDEDNRLYTMAILDKYYKTDFAVDGYEAIEAAKKKVYDIILMDINLGKDIDGIMATQEIRKMKRYKDTPIVALTAFVGEGDKEEFIAGGCTHYLGKPFTVKQLLGLVEEIVQSKE